MARKSLLILLVIAVALSGCFGAPTASWGSGDGEIKVDWNRKVDSQIEISSRISGTTHEMSLTAQGCSENDATLKMGTTGVVSNNVRVAGWLIASQQFPDGAQSDSAAQNVAPASVLIAIDSFSEAKEKSFDMYDKLTIKSWEIPTSVTTMPKLDSDNLKHGQYGIIALIPANENMLDGFVALDNWQQPIELVGYAVNPNNPTGGVLAGEWTVNEECRATAVSSTGVTMVVTRINLEDGSITAAGDADNEWALGDVPIIGAYLYMIILLAVGGGGAAFLFMVSMGLERRGAKLTAREMLTEAQVQMARIVKKEVRQARRDGIDMEVGSMIGDDGDGGGAATEAAVELDKFDVESVLSGVSDGQLVGMELGGGEAMITEDALDMGDQLQEDLEGGVVNLGESTERIGHTLAFDIDDILDPAAEEESGYGFLGGGAPASGGGDQRPRGAARDSAPAPDRRRMAGRQSGSSERGGDEPPVRRRSVKKSRGPPSGESGGGEERRAPPKRRAAPKEEKAALEDDDFSDFSF